MYDRKCLCKLGLCCVNLISSDDLNTEHFTLLCLIFDIFGL